MKWPKYLDQYPRDVVATFLGVKPGTVRRWKSSGKIPAKHTEAVRALRKAVKVPNKRARARELKRTDEAELVELLSLAGKDVSLSTVRRWKRKGDIPPNFRGFMIDSSANVSAVKKLTTRRTIVRKEFNKWIFHEVRFDIGQTVTDTLVREIGRIVGSQKTPPKSKKQFMLSGTVAIQFAEDDILKYKTGTIVLSDEVVSVETFTSQWVNYRKAISALRKTLLDYIRQGFYLETLTLLISEKKHG